MIEIKFHKCCKNIICTFALTKVLISFSSFSDILSGAPDVDADVPYHLRCNKDRFPYWYGKHDPRNKKLKERIEKFKQKHKFSVENKCPFIYNLAYVTVNKTSFGAVKTCPSAADDNF